MLCTSVIETHTVLPDASLPTTCPAVPAAPVESKICSGWMSGVVICEAAMTVWPDASLRVNPTELTVTLVTEGERLSVKSWLVVSGYLITNVEATMYTLSATFYF